jgi:hypothetical protein
MGTYKIERAPPTRHNALGFFGWGRRSLKIHTEILKN